MDIRIVVYAILLALFSLFVIVAKPDMHKQAIITDSGYEFVQVELPPAQLKASDTPIEVVPQGVKNIDSSAQKPVKTTNTGANRVNVVNDRPKPQPKQVNKTAPQPQSKPQAVQQKPKETVKTQPQPVEQKPVEKKEQTVQQQPKQTKPTLSEQEEIIVWNKWRSRLQNQVMMDSKVAAPLGTQFKFSFTVDKFGNMSNVKVWSTSPAYTDYAVRVIKPVLMSYRNKPILNFPEGTKRIITNVEGGFVISRTTQYSTPSDYSDYEKVKR